MMNLRVRSVTYEATDILSFELVSADGAQLPGFDAGAHIDVRTPCGQSRRYSLCGDPEVRASYRIAVLQVADSRGGSRSMHQLRPGDRLEVSGPHNFFPLASAAHHSILLAGGIGVTPLLAMLRSLERIGSSFEMHLCTRSPERTPFLPELARHVADAKVRLHHDLGDPLRGLDIRALLREHRSGTHVYFCGPAGFMRAASAACAHWPRESVHFEYFGAQPPSADAVPVEAATQHLRLARSGRVVPISAGQTMLQALRAAGIECASSCEAGLCGTCRTAYLEGKPKHQDLLLSDEERERDVLICCAHVEQGPVVLDL